ncbi:outer membrane lipoprotein carrier protein LolA [Duganella sp. FT80W]|uniref:Outer membrane lipoprotein carrier protein LolA n=1 Tax=Duganella guangzhouensis TaxID=2666084 RepID=A0A6I2KTJ8_9BURK|nr:outer membrane lipoprotein carrier protein LolA [Duganella guangzhouensis]MRW89275.1 outer membrane lipoprotein carrier protein LolA [Duganella guangzhouensis]
MNKFKFLIAATLLCAGAAQAAVPAAKIQAMLAKPAVMCGRFDQTKTLAGMKKPLASEGRFCVVAGKGVLWRTLKPFPSTLRLTRDEIVNYQGDRVAMRLDAKTEPTVRVINNVLFSLLSGDLGQLDTLFEGDGSVDANSWNVSLKPRQAALEKAIGTIKLDGGAYVKSIVMNEGSGDRTHIVFSDIKTGEAAMSKEEAALF